MSITGRRDLIPHFQYIHNAPVERTEEEEKICHRYDRRNKLLKSLGYSGYREYLRSQDWRCISDRVLKSSGCILCDRPSAVVHHARYTADALLGTNDDWLAPMCKKCHEYIEVDDSGKKRPMGGANRILFEDAKKTDRGNAWLRRWYAACRKTPRGSRERNVIQSLRPGRSRPLS